MRVAVLRALVAAGQARLGVVVATRLGDGAQVVWVEGGAGAAGGLGAVMGEVPVAEGAVAEAAGAAFAAGRSAGAEIGGAAWFLQVQAPSVRLVIVGAVHIGQALAGFAGALGWAVSVVDPRAAFNSAERFGGAVTRVVGWPGDVMAGLVDGRTAVVALAHDPKLDDAGLDAALRGGAFYVGALGSRRSHAARLERLAGLGHGAAALGRVRGPVGLALGARQAEEIALSVAAEMVAVLRGAALGVRGGAVAVDVAG